MSAFTTAVVGTTLVAGPVLGTVDDGAAAVVVVVVVVDVVLLVVERGGCGLVVVLAACPDPPPQPAATSSTTRQAPRPPTGDRAIIRTVAKVAAWRCEAVGRRCPSAGGSS